MRKTTNQFWNAVAREYRANKGAENLKLCLMEKLKDEYLRRCDERYRIYKEKFMKPGVKNLDRHKVASILAVEGIALNLIRCEQVPEDQIFIGQEKILLKCALQFIIREFNSIIRTSQFASMQKFVLPEAFSCDTQYIDIMCRNLMYIKESKLLDDPEHVLMVEMELAEKFFLLEYIAIRSSYRDKAEDVYRFLHQVASSN